MTLAEQMTKNTVFFLEHFPVGVVVPMDTLTILIQLLRRLTLTYRNKRQEALHYSSLSLFSSSSSPSPCLSPCAYHSWNDMMQQLLLDTSIAITTRANRRTFLLWPTSSAFTAVNTITSTLETFTFPPCLLSEEPTPASSLEEMKNRESTRGKTKTFASEYCNTEPKEKVECDENKPHEKAKREAQTYAAAAALLQLADDIILSLHELRLPQMGDEEVILFMEHLAFYRQQQRRFSLFYSSNASTSSYPNPFTGDTASSDGERAAGFSSSTSCVPTPGATPLSSSPLFLSSPPLCMPHSPPVPSFCVRPTPRGVVWEGVCKRCCAIVPRVKSPASHHRLARAVIAGDDFHFCASHVVSFPTPLCGVSATTPHHLRNDTYPIDEKDTQVSNQKDIYRTAPALRKDPGSSINVQEEEVPMPLLGMSATPGPHQQYLMRALLLQRQHSTVSTTTTTTYAAPHPSHHPLPTTYPALHDRLTSVVYFHRGTSFSSLLQHLLQLSERMLQEFSSVSHHFQPPRQFFPLSLSAGKDANDATRERQRMDEDRHGSRESSRIRKVEMWGKDHQTDTATTNHLSPSASFPSDLDHMMRWVQQDEKKNPFQEVVKDDGNREEDDEEEEDDARVMRMLQKGSDGDADDVGEASAAEGEHDFVWRKHPKEMEEGTKEEEDRERIGKNFYRRTAYKGKTSGACAARRSFPSSSSSPATQVDFLFSPSTTTTRMKGSGGAAEGGKAAGIDRSTHKGAAPDEKREGRHLPSRTSLDRTVQEVVRLLHRLRKVPLPSPPSRGEHLDSGRDTQHDADGGRETSETGKESSRGEGESTVGFTMEEGLPLLLCYTTMRPLWWEDDGKEDVEVEGETRCFRRDSSPSGCLPVSPSSFAGLAAAWNPFLTDVVKTNLLWLTQRISAPSSLSSSSSPTFLPSYYFIVLSLLMGEQMGEFVAARQKKAIQEEKNHPVATASPLTAAWKEEEEEEKKRKGRKENKENGEKEAGVEDDLDAIKQAYGIVLRAFLEEEMRPLPLSTSSSSTRLPDAAPWKAKGARLWALMIGSSVLRTLERCTTASPSAPVSPALELCGAVDHTCAAVLHDWQRVAGLASVPAPLPFGEASIKAAEKEGGRTKDRERKQTEPLKASSSFLASQACAHASSPALPHLVTSTAYEAACAALELLHVMAIFWPLFGTASTATHGKGVFPSFSVTSSSSFLILPSCIAALLQTPTLSRQLPPNAMLETVVVLSTLQTAPWWRWAVEKGSSRGPEDYRHHSSSSFPLLPRRMATSLACPTPTPVLSFTTYVVPFLQVYEHLLGLLTGYPEVEKHVHSLRTLLLPWTCATERMSSLSHGNAIAAATAVIGRGTAEGAYGISGTQRSGPSTLLDLATNALEEARGGGEALGKLWNMEELEKRFRVASPSVWAPPSLSPRHMAIDPLARMCHSHFPVLPCPTAGLSSRTSSMQGERGDVAALEVGRETTTATYSAVSSSSSSSSTSSSSISPPPRMVSSSSHLSLSSYLPDPILDIYVRWLLFTRRKESSSLPAARRTAETSPSRRTTTAATKEEVPHEAIHSHDGPIRHPTYAIPFHFATVPAASSPLLGYTIIAPVDTAILLSFFEERQRDVPALAKAFQILFTRRLGQSAPLLSRLSASRSSMTSTGGASGGKAEAQNTSDAFHALDPLPHRDHTGRDTGTHVMLPVFGLLRLLHLLVPLYVCKEISYRSIAHRIFDHLSSPASLQQCESIPDLFPLAAVLSEPLCVAVRSGPLFAQAIQQRATFLASTALSILNRENDEKNRCCAVCVGEKSSESSAEEKDASVRKQWDRHSRKPHASWGGCASLAVGGTARDKGLLIAYIIRAELKVDEEMLRVFRLLTLKEKECTLMVPTKK